MICNHTLIVFRTWLHCLHLKLACLLNVDVVFLNLIPEGGTAP